MKASRALLFAVASISCVGSVSIREVLVNPGKYDGHAVTISGEVVTSTNLLLLRYYKIKDGTGEIIVITKRAVPVRGAQVRVRGVVHQAFAIAGESFTVLTEEGD
jgi:hypothetical protein